MPYTARYEVETMLESFAPKQDDSSPYRLGLRVPCFKMPKIFYHDASCDCHCQLPAVFILACQTASLEASMYFRSNETVIADNYFKGALRMLSMAEGRFKPVSSNYEKYITEFASRSYTNELRRIRLEFLIEISFFELSRGNFKEADDLIVNIHELTELGDVDPYVMNEVMNLMTASAQLRGIIKRPELTGLEMELEDLRLSPPGVVPCTPENKGSVPQVTKKVVKNEEIMFPVRFLEVNFDDIEERNDVPVKPGFKVPVPMTGKPVLEDITPRPTRSRPKLTLTQPSVELPTPIVTPNVKSKKNEFLTPMGSPEQFFTPMSTLRTYSKVRSGVVKKLEEEFSTPKGKEPESAPVRSRSKAKQEGLRMLKRATSPGKIEKENQTQTRTRRQRKINNNV